MVTSVTSVVLVLLLGRFYGDVHMPIWKWIAVGVAIWIGAMTFAALAVAIGYRFMPDTVQPITMFIWLGMSLLGGLWFPVSSGFLANIAKALPTYEITRIATGVIAQGTISMGRAGIILAWLAGFVALAALSVRSTAEKI
jgi:ABC-2 type transport system permease protein